MKWQHLDPFDDAKAGGKGCGLRDVFRIVSQPGLLAR